MVSVGVPLGILSVFLGVVKYKYSVLVNITSDHGQTRITSPSIPRKRPASWRMVMTEYQEDTGMKQDYSAPSCSATPEGH